MEESGGEARVTVAVRKRRSQPFRRPRPDETNYQSSSSPARASDDASDEITGGDTNSSRKEFNLNQCAVRVSSSGKTEADGGFSTFYSNEPTRSGSSNKRSSEGVLAPANWKNSSSRDDNCEWQNGECPKGAAALDEFGSESKVRKVKLKVGGVTRTISTSNGASESGSSKNSQASELSRRGNQNAQGNSEFASSSDKKSGLKGIPWKDFSKGGFCFGKRDPSTVAMKNAAKTTAAIEKKGDRAESVRKSKRVPKRRLMDGEFDDEDDDEIRFVQKLKAPKAILVNKDSDEESGKKQRKLVSVSDLDRVAATKANRDGKRKLRTEDIDYVEEDEAGSDGGVEGSKKKKKQKKESIDNSMENNKETMTLTTRQRALQSSKDASSLIEFPNGLPPAPSKKQKEKLTEVEQQLKKAEAAQKRRIQNEKAARESEAEAIRKILGQDSNRKKKEDKIKKRQEALAEEKAATASLLSGSTVRWVSGPAGTTVTFPNEMGLPKIFDPKPCSYPPPREKCAGPGCSNPYKYRDSKTNVPLCSLQCYKAVQPKTVVTEGGSSSTSS